MYWKSSQRSLSLHCNAPNFPACRAEQAELQAPHNLQSALLPKPLSEFGLICHPFGFGIDAGETSYWIADVALAYVYQSLFHTHWDVRLVHDILQLFADRNLAMYRV